MLFPEFHNIAVRNACQLFSNRKQCITLTYKYNDLTNIRQTIYAINLILFIFRKLYSLSSGSNFNGSGRE